MSELLQSSYYSKQRDVSGPHLLDPYSSSWFSWDHNKATPQLLKHKILSCSELDREFLILSFWDSSSLVAIWFISGKFHFLIVVLGVHCDIYKSSYSFCVWKELHRMGRLFFLTSLLTYFLGIPFISLQIKSSIATICAYPFHRVD
jgi:hypothetical protein